MPQPAILAIDQGTSNSKASLISGAGEVLAQTSRAMKLSHPGPGWAECDAQSLWLTVRDTVNELAGRNSDSVVVGVAIANQRESVLLWDAKTGEPVTPCIVWQCRRSAEICDQMRVRGIENGIIEKTGLCLDPLFSASKIAYLLDNEPDLRSRALRDQIKAGTVDSWLIWNLTAGMVHATDVTNASRTQLMRLDSQDWDAELAEWFGVPLTVLPEIRASNATFGATAKNTTTLPAGIPICAVMGDSHAALYGHGIRKSGKVKVTLGTGSSLMAVTQQRVHSRNGLSSTIAWSLDGMATHALEGNIAVSGQAAEFAARLLNLRDANELTALAQTVDDTSEVAFVPALAGLGAPHWKERARGQIVGMSLATKPAHVARAALEAIVLQIHDVFDAMQADLGNVLEEVLVDGGAASNDFLVQMLANILNRPVVRPAVTEVTALGVARMAARSRGLEFGDNTDAGSTVFRPAFDDSQREQLLAKWKNSLRQLQ